MPILNIITSQFTLQTTLLRLSVLNLTTSHTFMYKKLDEFGLNHDEKILKRVGDESKRLTQINKEIATPCSNNNPAANDDPIKEYHVDHQKMQAIVRSFVRDQIDKDSESDEFVEGMNKLLRRRNYAAVRRTEKTEDKQEQTNEEEGTAILLF